MKHLMTIKGALYAAIGVFLLNILLVVLGVYEAFPNIDIPMHVLGGFLMGCLAWGIAAHFVRDVRFGSLKPITRYVMSFLYILGFVALVSVFWEAYEFLADLFMQGFAPELNENLAGTRQGGVQDMLGDFAMDFIGGAIAWWLGKEA
jgi:hypothetical protein